MGGSVALCILVWCVAGTPLIWVSLSELQERPTGIPQADRSIGLGVLTDDDGGRGGRGLAGLWCVLADLDRWAAKFVGLWCVPRDDRSLMSDLVRVGPFYPIFHSDLWPQSRENFSY